VKSRSFSPRGKSAVAWQMFLPDKMAGFSSVEDNANNRPINHSWCYMPDNADGGPWTAILRVRKDGVMAYLNGRLMSNLPKQLSEAACAAGPGNYPIAHASDLEATEARRSFNRSNFSR